MKTKAIRSLCLMYLFISILSCEAEMIDKMKGSRPIFVTAAIDAPQTRATDVGWEKDDAIGIYMKAHRESLSLSQLAQNMKYITKGTSVFNPENESDEVLFPFDGSPVDFIAYYPYRKTITGLVYPINLSKQTNLSAIDLLYSNNANKLSSTNPNVNMVFSHQLSKIVLNIKSLSPKLDLSGLAVKITDMGTTASFSLSDATLSEPLSKGDIFLRVNPTGTFAEAILLPTPDLKDKKLIFMAGNTWFTYDLSASSTITSFAKSTKYTYSITLNPEVESAKAEGSIEDWTEGAKDEATIGQDPYDGKGSQENPYTVKEAIQYQGKKDVWVKGVIVGYKSGASYTFSAENAPATNIAIASKKDITDFNGIIPVQLLTGQIREVINLKDNPTMLHKEVLLKGNLGEYLSVAGLQSTKGAVINGMEYPTP